MLLWHANNGIICDMNEREGDTSTSFNHWIDHSDQGDCEDELTQIVSEVESNFPISHMNLKSSVLCPQTRSLTSQYLALEQLNAHQRMIARAKGCVDTSAPKSLQSYLSSLDKRKKALGQMSSIAKGTSMNGSISESRVLSPSADHTENVHDQQEIMNDSSDGLLNKGIQASIPFPGYSSKVADKISWYLDAVHQGEFLLQESGNRSRTERNAHRSVSRSSLSSSIRSSKVVKGDLLDWHQDKFTQSGRLFSPRILVNNNSKSKVRDMRCYNPPRRRKANSSINSTETFESYEDDETPAKDNSSYKDWLSEQAWRAQTRRQIKSRMIDPGNSHYMSSHDLATPPGGEISCNFMPFQEGLMASEVVDEQRSRKSDLPFEVMGKTDEKFSEFAAAESTVSEKQDLIDLVNELQNKLSEAGQSLNISLPQIVVVGCQSAGKSSVLENIVGREFLPRGAGTVTKRPLIVQLQPCDKEYAVFHHKPNENFVDFQEVKKEIESETEKEVGDGTFSSKPINLKIFSPNVLKLTLVDLPGLIKNPLVNQSEGIVQEVRDMVKSYISQENSLILAISPANQDIANSDSLNIAKTVDPDRERTIGVLTKLDIMDMGTDAREILENKVIPLKRGYIGIVNRSQNDIEENRDIKYILEKEKCFFHSHRKYRHMANRMGTPFLQEFLHKQLRAHIQTSLPSVKSELDEKYHSCFKELSDLNEKLGYTDKASKNIFMIRLINQFEDNLRLRLEGQSERVELEKISAGARMNYVFYTEIQELLNQDLLPGDEKLINAIANINGFRTGIAVPSLAFDAICRLLIEQYKTPMERAVSTIADILAGAVKESAETVSRYPSLKNEILYLVCDEIKEEENKTKNNLKKHIEAEMYFFNLGHPDFESSILQQVAPTAGPIKIWDENCDVEESQTHEEILKKKLMMNEATKKKVNYISAMISKYMEIIRKNISDVTVKYIMFFLVKRVLDFAKQDLLGILLESGKTDQLLKESEADVQRKLELENTCRAITNALQVVKNF